MAFSSLVDTVPMIGLTRFVDVKVIRKSKFFDHKVCTGFDSHLGERLVTKESVSHEYSK